MYLFRSLKKKYPSVVTSLLVVCVVSFYLISAAHRLLPRHRPTEPTVKLEALKRISQSSGLVLPILTLFTSMSDRSSKEEIHDNTLANWATMTPHVTLILFVPDVNSPLAMRARSHGWNIQPCPELSTKQHTYPRKTTDSAPDDTGDSTKHPPVFRLLFVAAQNITATTFYAYANADILFDDGLIRTLELLKGKLGKPSEHLGVGASGSREHKNRDIKPLNNRGFLAVGKRVNADIGVLQSHDLSQNKLGTLREKGRTFLSGAQDYFITTRGGFPWAAVPDFVLGRLAYDNWLVAQARVWNYTVVDCTGTVLALHQTDRDGKFGGHGYTDSLYNLRLAGDDYKFWAGVTDCAPYKTVYEPAPDWTASRPALRVRLTLPAQCALTPLSTFYRPHHDPLLYI